MGDEDEPFMNNVFMIRIGNDILFQRNTTGIINHLHAQRKDLDSPFKILHNDPESPFLLVKNFNELHLKPELLAGLYDMKYRTLSGIQESTLPKLLVDPPMSLIAQSQNGTGKTAAFVLTMLNRCDPTKNYHQCLCLAPTRELVLQIGDVTKKMAKFMPNVRISYAIHGESVSRSKAIEDHIVIGTPGTVIDWCMKFKCIDLEKIDVFVLDEADMMIDKQCHPDNCVRIVRSLHKDCQRLFFSATYDEDQMKVFAETIVPNAVTMRLTRKEEILPTIRQYYIDCLDREDKFKALSNIYGYMTIGQSMIFCQTKETALWLEQKMRDEGNMVAVLYAELDLQKRADTMKRFRAGEDKMLITTNICARGIDVEQVTVVVNFDLPLENGDQLDYKTYLHRIGRTGRFGKRGVAINMIEPISCHMMHAIEEHFGCTINRLDAVNADVIEKITQP